ncbi:MAG: diaminopimelate epimerase [Thermoleophilia bacterium]
MQFSKWHGLGNDYLVVDTRDATPTLTPARVRRICDYHLGVGSDGILEVVATSGDGPAVSILIWNPDGSVAEMSGNGTRIAARWLAARTGADDVRVVVGDLVVRARLRERLLVEQEMGLVRARPLERIDVDGEEVELTPVSVGNPHAVVRRDPDRSELLRLGPLIERHPRFPDRTNVQLVRVDGRHAITVGVWERGAGETLSSGTSSCAAAAAAVANGWCESPVEVSLPGGMLTVALDAEGRATLTGPAQEICRGELAPELLADLEPLA